MLIEYSNHLIFQFLLLGVMIHGIAARGGRGGGRGGPGGGVG